MSDGDWWEHGPIFSVQDRGGSITALAPDEHVRTFTAGLLAVMLASAAAWTAVFVLWVPRWLPSVRREAMTDATSGWSVPLLILAVLAMLGATCAAYAVAHRLFRQVGIAFAAAALPAAVGMLAGCGIDGALFRESVGSTGGPDGTILLVFMGVAAAALVVMLLWMPFAVARAHRRSRMIVALRQHGVRHEGEVVTIGRRDGTLLGFTLFRRGEVTFDGGRRRVEVAMSTRPSRVPLPTFPVLVFTGEGGAIHVDPDPARPWPFDPDTAKYESSADGGGG